GGGWLLGSDRKSPLKKPELRSPPETRRGTLNPRKPKKLNRISLSFPTLPGTSGATIASSSAHIPSRLPTRPPPPRKGCQLNLQLGKIKRIAYAHSIRRGPPDRPPLAARGGRGLGGGRRAPRAPPRAAGPHGAPASRPPDQEAGGGLRCPPGGVPGSGPPPV